jgi:uncharacterized lipoprotein
MCGKLLASQLSGSTVNRILSARCTVYVVAVAGLLGGCSMFHHHHDNYYSKAQETKPLEVPPDLDTPVSSNELTVPAAGTQGASAAGSNSAVTSAPPPVSVTGDSLHVADSVGHAWTRVGLALERAQIGTISERNEAAHSYTLDVAGLTAPSTPAPEPHHWYAPLLHPFGGGSKPSASSTPVSGHLTVTVSADGDGSRVEVAGPSGDASAAEAARRVISALRERLS